LCIGLEIPHEIVLSLFVAAPDPAMSVPGISQPLNLEITVDTQWIFDRMEDGSWKEVTARDRHRTFTDVYAVHIDVSRDG
jgi:hypothetical protein